jgi:hypothetical protein
MAFLKIDEAEVVVAAAGVSARAGLAASVVGILASDPDPAAFAFVGDGTGDVASASDDLAAVGADAHTHPQVRASSTRFVVGAAVFPGRDRILGAGEVHVLGVAHILLIQGEAYPGLGEDPDLEEALVRGGNLAGEHTPEEDGRLARAQQDYEGGLVHGVEVVALVVALVVVAGEGGIVLEMKPGRRRGRGGRRELGDHQGLHWV